MAKKTEQITARIWRSTHTKIVKGMGKYMAQTGEQISMGDYLDRLVDQAGKLKKKKKT